MSHQSVDETAEFEWRQLGRYLWAGAGRLGPVGTIERGRRFNAIATSGAVVGRYRTLQDAEALLEQLAGVQVRFPQELSTDRFA